MIYFDPTTGAFYLPGTQTAASIKITAERHSELLAGQSAGKKITAGADGKPVLADILQSFSDLKAVAIRRIEAEFERRVDDLTADYTLSERISFSAQDAEARSVAANPKTSAPLLSAIAAKRGSAVEELAQKVINKSGAYQAAFGSLLGRKQALMTKLEALNNSATQAEFDALTF